MSPSWVVKDQVTRCRTQGAVLTRDWMTHRLVESAAGDGKAVEDIEQPQHVKMASSHEGARSGGDATAPPDRGSGRVKGLKSMFESGASQVTRWRRVVLRERPLSRGVVCRVARMLDLDAQCRPQQTDDL